MNEVKKIRIVSLSGEKDYGIEDSALRQDVQQIVEGAPEELNTFKEAFEAFKEGNEMLAAVRVDVQKNADAIAAEVQRAQAAEQKNADAIVAEKARAQLAEQKNADAIVAEKARAEMALTTEVEKLKKSDTIVGQAREIHSRNGKNDSASFLARTTAGSGTIGDGVANLKSVGGNIVKNLVNSVSTDGWASVGNTANITHTNGIYTIQDVKNAEYTTVCWNGILDEVFRIYGHAYYYSCAIKANNSKGDDVIFGVVSARGVFLKASTVKNTDEWQNLSFVTSIAPSNHYYGFALADIRADKTTPVYAKDFMCIDLTEMFGEVRANQMTKEECDELFGAMDALPQGLSIANPSIFKSTGWNQFNPDMVLVNKVIVDGAIDDGDKTLAVIPCLPCKIGVGENNGYHIHGYGVDENTRVYFTPLNPMEITGELYMHELTLSEIGTYVPQIKGYMIVEVPTTANLCAHFLWSEDCDKNAYEPYYESVVALPRIPEMSEYGLAGIYVDGELVADTIDLEKAIYIKKLTKDADGNFLPLTEPIEYPLPKVNNNYTSSDYGVEQFDGSVPCNANNLYYMRSLAGETRNFLDRLMAGLGTTDATALADRILAVVNPTVEPTNFEPETPIEE